MIGLIGLGNMGRAIGLRLIDEGDALTVWNRTASRARELGDVTVAANPAEVAGTTDLVLSVLGNDAAIEAVYFGETGLLSRPLGGTVIVEMCTTSSAQAQRLDAAVTEAGGLFLECPVGGTIGPARAGKLLGLAGGSAEAFDKSRPVLEKLTRRLEHLGPAGTGAAMKLAINLPLMVYWSALHEALGLALDKGVDPSLALDILVDSSGAAASAKMRAPALHDMLVEGQAGATNFSLDNAIKDMGLMVDALADPQMIAAALTKATQARAAGYGALDCSYMAAQGLGKATPGH